MLETICPVCESIINFLEGKEKTISCPNCNYSDFEVVNVNNRNNDKTYRQIVFNGKTVEIHRKNCGIKKIRKSI